MGSTPWFHGMVGRSAPMQALFRRIAQVAPLDVAVLILGETGTGKELVARAVQRLSRRRDRRFEVVNAGGLGRELLPSELFGHERGAFTGAIARQEGLLAAAHGGTLFLDEIGELSAQAQAMLLRFVQHGEIRPLGSGRTRRVDVRLIAATHRDLTAGIALGAFREDLYYRLRRVVLEVPPLRERREDIPLLAERIRVGANARHGLAIAGITREVLALIERAPWPGNVRELEAVLEEAMILRRDGWIERRDIDLPRPSSAGEDALFPTPVTPLQREALRLAAERHEIRKSDLMARCGISREVARRQLAGLVRAALLRRIGTGRGARYVRVAAAVDDAHRPVRR